MTAKSKKRRIGKKPVMQKQVIAPEPTPLQEALWEISADLEDLQSDLRYLPGCSIHEIESQVWDVVRRVKTIADKVQALGDE